MLFAVLQQLKMTQSTTVTRIKCGKIYILSNNKFSLICKFCENEFFVLEDLRAHLTEHFPDSPTNNIKNEDSISCGSDWNSVPPIIRDRTDFKDIIKEEVVSEHNEESSASLNNQLDAEQSDGNQSNQNHEPQSNSDNEIETTTATTATTANRYPKRLRKPMVNSGLMAMILNDVNQTKVTKRQMKTKNSTVSIIIESNHTPKAVCRDLEKSTRTKFQCRFCKKIITSRQYLNNHENTHTGKRPFECHICTRAFSDSKCLLRHMDTHTDKPRYRCSVCKKKFIEKSKLSIHTREKHLPDTDPRRYFSCTLCDIKLKTCSQQRKHRRTHNMTPSIFVCDYCRKEFKRKDHLVRHMVIHSGQTPYNCNICNRPFSWLSNKLKHERKCSN